MVTAMRVLIVEDDERLAEIFRDFIGELGYQPTVVGSAERALEALTTARPDTILLDIRLPGMSGVELQDHLAASGQRIPIVFMTAHADAGVRARVLANGAVEFLQKPFNDDALLEAIDASLRVVR